MVSSNNKGSKYSRLEEFPEDFPGAGHQEEHVQMTYFAEVSKTWHHIENLDDFFKRVYLFHQRNGFLCIATSEAFSLLQFAFVVFLATLLIQCIDYPLLFQDTGAFNISAVMSESRTNFLWPPSVKLKDVVYPLDQCLVDGSTFMGTLLLLAILFWIFRLARAVIVLSRFWETRQFYESALVIPSRELSNYTWFDVLERLKRVQCDQQMCIHKRELTSLDIYSRILRFKNYEIAMINKEILPVKFFIPCFGQYTFLSQGLKLNFALILFWGPGSPFGNNWSLKEVYKRKGARVQLAKEMSNRILVLGILNLLLAPVVFFYQLLLSFFSYADLIKRDPSSLGMRKWSLYSRLYLRHYNELEHEFNARLSRAYKPATMYLNCFMSTFMSIVAHNVAFFSGSICAVILLLALIDQDVLQVDNIITLLTATGVLTAVSRVFIPEDNFIFCPELLLKSVLAHIHYMPATWRGKAHTSDVRDEFSKFFQLKFVFFLEELLSPIVTPLILLFSLRNKSLQVVDFLRNFSIDVAGVGDVCSFAQLEINKHGNPHWLDEDDELNEPEKPSDGKLDGKKRPSKLGPSQAMQSEDGKTELSLVNFALTNPNWKPNNQSSDVFLSNLKGQVKKDASMMISVRNIEHSGFLHSMQNSSLFLQPLSIPPAIKESVLEYTQPYSSGTNAVNSSVLSSQGAQTNLPLKGSGISSKVGPLHQVTATSDSSASVYISHTSNFDDRVITEQSVLSLAVSSSNQHPISEANFASNDVISTEMSASVLKLHDRFHQNAASKCLSSDSNSSVGDGSYQNAPAQLSPHHRSDSSGGVVDPVTPMILETAVIGGGFVSDDEFDLSLTPLDRPPESII